ncbi:dethiobiotin synthase [Natronoglycomyces albus]|uniref:ATP-dependent dethiobiotin synthetase BioD n=1 Tax=Natronoglycomyces albus TaxID=2811108 RepID=A0A895XLT2_9ACTN|nr:dethiobiotin synthase [Natronoglycomyces albus]QSB06304.1 dethiobiotin synthase [Natronoglycomyces albus]
MFNGPVIITGTDTGVGKTIATAALAVALANQGHTVEAVKLAQTGDDDDAGTVARLSGVATKCLAHYPDPLAPSVAARRCGQPGMTFDDAYAQVRASEADVTLIEGAGGLLVPLGQDDWTVADLAQQLAAPVVVVARAGLGTINHTALTLAELDRRSLESFVVIGSWPNRPGIAEYENLHDLPGRRIGCIPEKAGRLAPAAFQRAAEAWLGQLALARAA